MCRTLSLCARYFLGIKNISSFSHSAGSTILSPRKGKWKYHQLTRVFLCKFLAGESLKLRTLIKTLLTFHHFLRWEKTWFRSKNHIYFIGFFSGEKIRKRYTDRLILLAPDKNLYKSTRPFSSIKVFDSCKMVFVPKMQHF